jgi:excinuclease ABC subunit C
VDRYFGPFPSAGAVRQTLGQLQKLFRIRQCSNSYFNHRSRPCLQYQIKRCTAPCVDLIDEHDYRKDVDNAIRFLSGKNDVVLIDLQSRMDQAAESLNFEIAAQYRDQIASIKDVQARQVVVGTGMKDTDALAVVSEAGTFCVAVLMVRGGRMLGSRHFFPKTSAHTESKEVLSAFIAQHYFSREAPPEILVGTEIDDRELLEAALTERAGRGVAIRRRVRGHRKRWLDMAATNAVQGLLTHRASNATITRQFESLTELLGLNDTPERIECFDISHTGGHEAVASCVVFGPQGAIKSAYRRFNIRGIEPGDDYAAIEQAVTRRYKRVLKGEAPMPDLVLIDGGRGQLGKAIVAMHELQLTDVTLLGVAKGQGRKPGREKLFLAGAKKQLSVSGDSPALHLIQQIRDEAHRFAITAHRQRRGKAQQQSVLESIPGLGPQRRKALLKAFGGLQGVKRSGIDDLVAVKGISNALAERIYNRLHGG